MRNVYWLVYHMLKRNLDVRLGGDTHQFQERMAIMLDELLRRVER